MRHPIFILSLLGSLSALGADDPIQPPRAAKSVHLSYVLPDQMKNCTAFYNQETVLQSVPGSYFQACGFNNGYFGIQDHGDGKKVAIFSVWDPTKGDDPKAVKDIDQVEMLYVGDQVRAKRFGGEGTGAQSMFDYDWKIGTPVKFYVTATVTGQKTAYAAYIQSADEKSWKHLATFRTRSGGKSLQGLYSFIEDFRRDTKSATQIRRAVYGNTWVRSGDGKWVALTKAKFTASGATWEAKDSIDAGTTIDHQFYLQTGGDTQTHTPLHTVMERSLEPQVILPMLPVEEPTTQK